MRIVVPDYYKDFTCIADACRHSCCIGWEIDIDAKTLAYYDSLDGEAGQRIRASIERHDTPHFRLAEGERCPHLDERGLCSIILSLGEGAICDICTEHPRFRTFFESREEIGIGLCCEEACRIILGKTEPVRLVSVSDDPYVEMPPEEADFFSHRDEIFAVLQDRSLDVDSRIKKLLARYDISLPYTDTETWCSFFLSLERLDMKWGSMLEALRTSDIELLDECPSALPAESGEQLLVYFIYRHLRSFASNGNYSDGIKLAVLCFYMIRAVCATTANGTVTLPVICEVARMFSSEIEYSEDNLAELIFELSF